MEISEFQRRIERQFLERDRARGVMGTFAWFVEEVGELAAELREEGSPEALAAEFADVFAWLASLASLKGVELDRAAEKYARGCPRCSGEPCTCPTKP